MGCPVVFSDSSLQKYEAGSDEETVEGEGDKVQTISTVKAVKKKG